MLSRVLNATIGKRIFFAAIVPIIGIALFGAYISSVEYSRFASLSRLHALATVAPKISAVVHELQTERALSSSFISSGGAAMWNDRLVEQVKRTDALLADFVPEMQAFPAADYGTAFEERLALGLTEIEQLAKYRENTLSRRTTIINMSEYYTRTIRQFLDTVTTASAIASDAEIKGRTTAYMSLLETKERAGLERAFGANGYGASNFDSLTHTNFITLIGQQDSFLAVFNAYATEDERTFYQTTVAGDLVDEVEYQRDVAVEAGYDELYDQITDEQWFDNITAKIDLIKVVEDHVSGNLIAAADNALSSAWTTLLVTIFSTLASLAIAGAACWFVGRSITVPLARLQSAMGEVANGAFDIDIAGAQRSDEVGDMARAVEVFRDQGRETNRLRDEQQRAEERAAKEKRESLEKMANDLESSIGQMIDTLSKSSGELEQTARTMLELASSTMDEAASVSMASSNATQNVETVAAAASQLSQAINEVTAQINKSATLTNESRAASEQTDVQMKNLADAATKIGAVMELIQEIAEQTNLLALNATIEAARAGEAGKGFAVVAAEVKDLANQTAKATGEIANHVSRVQEETATAAHAMSDIASKIGEINHVTTAVSSSVEEQSSATTEISRSAEETAEMNRNVSTSVDTMRSAAQQTGAAAEQVLSSAVGLTTTADELRKQVGQFVASIRAA
ncbi:MAG: nitrate- and nitrite sensing domain-containing protein [Alphaproteobacteria bacterium]|nr:nitrate- and nitrite sensing domain-containing protein [Alphaproteobacteria bacterium]MBO6628075.1 nitrate- and nitrite sensing domain-containing protein [Alphaproteobacteria bacterium]MDF1625239.1 nitrate- and nitrite sensing domain-containing protein [Parvibaculaceae bacterium]